MEEINLICLKNNIKNATELLFQAIENKKVYITDKYLSSMVSLLVYNEFVKDEVRYSYLDDFIINEGIIELKNLNKEQVKENLNFMITYLEYRIQFPKDLASA